MIAERVLHRRQRRSFVIQFMLWLPQQTTPCENHGEVAALPGIHGLYSSRIAQRRARFTKGGTASLAGQPAGREPTRDVKDRRTAELERQLDKLTTQLTLSAGLCALRARC